MTSPQLSTFPLHTPPSVAAEKFRAADSRKRARTPEVSSECSPLSLLFAPPSPDQRRKWRVTHVESSAPFAESALASQTTVENQKQQQQSHHEEHSDSEEIDLLSVTAQQDVVTKAQMDLFVRQGCRATAEMSRIDNEHMHAYREARREMAAELKRRSRVRPTTRACEHVCCVETVYWKRRGLCLKHGEQELRRQNALGIDAKSRLEYSEEERELAMLIAINRVAPPVENVIAGVCAMPRCKHGARSRFLCRRHYSVANRFLHKSRAAKANDDDDDSNE